MEICYTFFSLEHQNCFGGTQCKFDFLWSDKSNKLLMEQATGVQNSVDNENKTQITLSGAASCRCFTETLLWKLSKNSPENIHDRAQFMFL